MRSGFASLHRGFIPADIVRDANHNIPRTNKPYLADPAAQPVALGGLADKPLQYSDTVASSSEEELWGVAYQLGTVQIGVRSSGHVRADKKLGGLEKHDMGADRLDAQLEPLAQLALLIILLLVVAAVSTYILIKSAARRNERRHRKLSASKRLKETGINLLPRSEEGEPAPQPRRKSRRRRTRRPGEHHGIDILRRADESRGSDDPDPAAPKPHL